MWKKGKKIYRYLALILFLSAPFVALFAQPDASQLDTGMLIVSRIISSLNQLTLLNGQLMTESDSLSGNSLTQENLIIDSLSDSKKRETPLAQLENLAAQLGNLVDDQKTLYEASLRKSRFWLFGSNGLWIVLFFLSHYLRGKFRKKP